MRRTTCRRLPIRNNCRNAAGTVKVAAVVQPKPDLIVADLTDAPNSVVPSATFTRDGDDQEPGRGGERRLDDEVQSGQRRRPDPQEPQGSAERRGPGGGRHRRPGRDPQGVLATRCRAPISSRPAPTARGDIAESNENNNCRHHAARDRGARVARPRGHRGLRSAGDGDAGTEHCWSRARSRTSER